MEHFYAAVIDRLANETKSGRREPLKFISDLEQLLRIAAEKEGLDVPNDDSVFEVARIAWIDYPELFEDGQP